MATLRTLRPTLTSSLRSNPCQTTQIRPFLSAFTDSTTTNSPQVLTASRILPYPAYPIFSIIADIESYPHFVPLCSSATVTSLSNPDAWYARKWPQEATLQIGMPSRGISETFTSRVTCVPPHNDATGRAGVGVVEALSGSEVGGVTPRGLGYVEDEASHHTHAAQTISNNSAEAGSGPMALLRTRWHVREYPYKGPPEDGKPPQEGSVEPARPEAEARTQVSLRIEYKFQNSIYDVLAKAASGSLAERMVEAFEQRVKKLLDGHGETFGSKT